MVMYQVTVLHLQVAVEQMMQFLLMMDGELLVVLLLVM